MNSEWTISVLVGVIIITALVVILVKKNKKSVRQPWSQIGLGAYGPDTDPGAYTFKNGWNTVYTGDMTTAKALLNKWYNFVESVGPEVSGVIYAMFPNLQTKESIRYYKLTAKMIRD